MLTIGLLIGAFIALAIDHNIEDHNFVAPLMLIVALNINISTLLIGVVVGFAVISTCKKYTRISKIADAYERKMPEVNRNRKINMARFKHQNIFMLSFCISSILCYKSDNLSSILSIGVTIYLIIDITLNHVNGSNFTSQRCVKYIITLVLTLIAGTITVKQINPLNIFILFYGFITVPNYILPNQTKTGNVKDSKNISGLAFSMTTNSAIANGFVLAQGIMNGSEKDSIGTLINNYISDAERLPLTLAIIITLCTLCVSKELAQYFLDAPERVTNNNKPNNKFALVNIILGAFIAVTRYNPVVFVVIVILGMLSAAILRNNDNLRSLTVPSLLASGLILG